jgi:hypothetical protein
MDEPNNQPVVTWSYDVPEQKLQRVSACGPDVWFSSIHGMPCSYVQIHIDHSASRNIKIVSLGMSL